MEYLDGPDHSGLMLAARITFAHFSVSSAMNLPKSAGVWLVDFVDCIERYYIQTFPFLCCPSKRLRTMAALLMLVVGLAAPIFLRTEATAEDVL